MVFAVAAAAEPTDRKSVVGGKRRRGGLHIPIVLLTPPSPSIHTLTHSLAHARTYVQAAATRTSSQSLSAFTTTAAEFDTPSLVYRGMEMPVLRSSPKYSDMSLANDNK